MTIWAVDDPHTSAKATRDVIHSGTVQVFSLLPAAVAKQQKPCSPPSSGLQIYPGGHGSSIEQTFGFPSTGSG